MSTKDEIMEMPEGKTSEDIDAMMMEGEEGEKEFNADANLASEALEATEEESPAEKSVKDEATEEETTEESTETTEEADKVDPKDAVIGDFRRKNRDLELELAEAKGELKARQGMPVKDEAEVVELSPLQLAMEAEKVDSPDDLEKPYSTMVKQQAWEKEQDAKVVSKTTSETTSTGINNVVLALQEEEFSPEKKGVGLDLLSIKQFDDNLSKKDEALLLRVNTTQGQAATVRKYYDLVIARTLASGGQDAKDLQNAINAKKGKTVTQKKTLKTETDVDALITEGDDKPGETESEELSSRLYSFITT